MEEAVRRETLEETGIEVGEVIYHSSQPWPGTLCFIPLSVNVLVIPLLVAIVGSSFFFFFPGQKRLYMPVMGTYFPVQYLFFSLFVYRTHFPLSYSYNWILLKKRKG